MGTAHRIEKFNAREEVLSADLVRSQQLASKMVQDNVRDLASDGTGAGISYFSKVPTWSPVAASFNVNLGEGRGNVVSSSGVGVDDSDYQVIEWPNPTLLTFTAPNATNPRIDLVVVELNTVDQDLSARNVLVDPVARTQQVANLAKTAQPRSTLSVVAGTAAASPAPPAVPAGKFALYEVWVPAAAADSTTFTQSPRMFRRAPFPWSTMSGILSGCHLRWDLNVDFASTSSTISMVGLNHRIVIDGEDIEFATLFQVAASQDAGGANPFAVAAGASDKPYYVYAVGGRHAPQGTFTGSNLIPLSIVESLTPPDLDNYGRPTSAITTPRGAAPVEACVYIGIGFVVATSTRRRACIMDGDMTHLVSADLGVLAITKAGTGIEALGTLGSKPSVSQKVAGRLSLIAAAAGASLVMIPDRGDGAGATPSAAAVLGFATPRVRSQVAGLQAEANVQFNFNPANPKVWIGGTSLATSDSIGFNAVGYDHRVARIASQG